jgi:hypothetical protein
VSSLIIVLLNGVIAYASEPLPMVADQQLWNALGLRSLFDGPIGRSTPGIMGDGGFTFKLKRHVEEGAVIDGHVPTSMRFGGRRRGEPKPTRAEVFTPAVRERNRRFSQFRVVVENTIGQLKTWSILSTRYRGSMRGKGPVAFAKVHRIIVAIVNERLKLRPLRAPFWQPPPRRAPRTS